LATPYIVGQSISVVADAQQSPQYRHTRIQGREHQWSATVR